METSASNLPSPLDTMLFEKLRPLVEQFCQSPPGCLPLQSNDREDLKQTLWQSVCEHASQDLSDDEWRRLFNRVRQQWWRQNQRWQNQHNLQAEFPDSTTPWRSPGQPWPPEIILGEPDHIYHAQTEYLTSHLLADFRRSPVLYYKKKLGLIKDEEKPAYLIGRALHTLVLEGLHVFENQYAVGGPINPKTGEVYGPTTKTFLEWAAAQGKPVLTFQQHDLVQRMAEGVWNHAYACDLLTNGAPEAVVRSEYCHVPVQIRIDWLNLDRGIVELKTCDNLDWFEADARRFQYIYQVAFYHAVLLQSVSCLANRALAVYLIAIEKQEPYRCGVWLVHPHILQAARRENEAAIERLRQCMATNIWPSGYEKCRVFDAL